MASQPLDEEAIFHLARQIDSPAVREGYLHHVCGDNQALRARVQALLRVQEEDKSFLRVPAAEVLVTVEEPITERPGTVVGPYKLLESIGEGGFGVVFLAEQQEPVRRKVALKVLKPGMDSKQVIARFEAERQALALMDHPNIARVLDGGQTSSGRPYFVMDLVKGLPITEYCDQAQLPPRERLALFVHLCQAVQHAHQKGVIHRDLKPSNVLVTVHDTTPVVKVIDFGVAKALGQELTDKTLFTGFAQMIGTPLYMSPEQAGQSGLDIDTRSDIYSLGVLLFELLTGTTPFAKDRLKELGYDELRRIIREEEPPKPSTRLSSSDTLPAIAAARQTEPAKLTKLVRGELDWIVMKALEKDRTRRYETANGLAHDVERYLREEPVQAGPPGAGYRLRKFVRRNKGRVAAAAAMLVLLLAATAVSIWQAGETGQALDQVTREKAKTQGALEQVKRSLAVERVAKTYTRRALDALTNDVVEKSFARKPVLGEDERAFLRRVLGLYEDFTRDLGETAEARAYRSWGYFVVGRLRGLLGESEEAEVANRQAIALLEKLVEELPENATYRRALAESHLHLGNSLQDQGKYEGAEAAYRRARDLLNKLVAESPRVFINRASLARVYHAFGILLHFEDKLAEAEESCRQSLALYEKLADEFPKEPHVRMYLVGIRKGLGELLWDLGKHPEAEKLQRQALALAKKLVDESPSRAEYRSALAGIHKNLGNLAQDQGKYAEAEAAFRRALAAQERVAAEFPLISDCRLSLSASHEALGGLQLRLMKRAEAEASFDQVLAIRQKLVADFPKAPEMRYRLAGCYNARGVLLAELGKRVEAKASFHQGVDLCKKLAAEFPRLPKYWDYLANCQANLGILLWKLGKQTEAEEHFRQALDLAKKLAADLAAGPRFRRALAKQHRRIGDLLLDLGKRAEAEAEFRQVVNVYAKLVAESPKVPSYRQELARSHLALARTLPDLRQREALYDHALDLYKKLADDFPDVPAYREILASTHRAMGQLLSNLRKRAEAEAAYRQALAIGGKLAAEFPAVPGYRATLVDCYGNLGLLLAGYSGPLNLDPQQTYSGGGKHAAAEAAYHQALDLAEKLAAEFPDAPQYLVNVAVCQINIGNLFRAYKQPAKALSWYDRALPVLERLQKKDALDGLTRENLGSAHWNRGLALYDLKRYPEALAEFERAPPLASRAQRRWMQQELAARQTIFGNLLLNQHRPAEALAWYDRALAVLEPLHKQAPDDDKIRRRLRDAHWGRARTLDDLKRHVKALPHWDRAVELSPPRERLPVLRGQAGSHVNYGNLLSGKQQQADALAWYDRALAILEPLHKEEGAEDRTTRRFLRNAHQSRAQALHELKRDAEALPHWDRAVELSPPDERPPLRMRRALSRARAGKTAEAVAEAEALTKEARAPSYLLCNAACVYCVASAAVKEDAKQREAYAGRAVALLRRAQAAGFFKDRANVEPLKKEPVLDVLRSREDFKKIVAELDAALKP
jgi:serine/threonine protein kinase/tetratricopeptide (TPR) repeat protein